MKNILYNITKLFCYICFLMPQIINAEGHDGDENIFPGDAVALSTPLNLSELILKEGYIGEVVPPEDSDKIPRNTCCLMALEFKIDGEAYRFTHGIHLTKNLRAHLESLANNKFPSYIDGSRFMNMTIHLTYYYGSAFRDGVHRVSGFWVYPLPGKHRQ